MTESQAAQSEATSTKDSGSNDQLVTDENGVISPRRMKYALKKENSTAEGYVSMIRSKSDRTLQADSIINGSGPAKVVRQSSSEALVETDKSDKKSNEPAESPRPRAQTVGTINSNTKQADSPRTADPEPPKTARADVEKKDRKEKEKHKRTHTKKPSLPHLSLETIKATSTAKSSSKHEEPKKDKRDKKDKKDKHAKRSETIASPRQQAAAAISEEPKVRFGEPQIKFTEPVRDTPAPPSVDTHKAVSSPHLNTVAAVSGPVVDLFIDHLIAQKGPLKRSIDQLIHEIMEQQELATKQQVSELQAKIEQLTHENQKLKSELDALKKK